jgi:hypothetical protein
MVRIAVLLIPLLCSCKPNAEPATNDVGYKIKTTFFTNEDETSPLGYWETKIEYPELSSNDHPFKQINTAISHTATEFQCDESKGDKQFSAEVTLLNEKIISLKFSDSWYCAGMPHSQGKTGALTFNLETGEKVSIEKEIKNDMKKELDRKLSSGLKQALKIKQVDGECPLPDVGYFYSTKTDIVFVNKSDDQEVIQCEVEFKIAYSEIKKYLKETSVLLTSSQ